MWPWQSFIHTDIHIGGRLQLHRKLHYIQPIYHKNNNALEHTACESTDQECVSWKVLHSKALNSRLKVTSSAQRSHIRSPVHMTCELYSFLTFLTELCSACGTRQIHTHTLCKQGPVQKSKHRSIDPGLWICISVHTYGCSFSLTVPCSLIQTEGCCKFTEQTSDIN